MQACIDVLVKCTADECMCSAMPRAHVEPLDREEPWELPERMA